MSRSIPPEVRQLVDQLKRQFPGADVNVMALPLPPSPANLKVDRAQMDELIRRTLGAEGIKQTMKRPLQLTSDIGPLIEFDLKPKRRSEKSQVKDLQKAALDEIQRLEPGARVRYRYLRPGQVVMVSAPPAPYTDPPATKKFEGRFSYVFATMVINGGILFGYARCSPKDIFNKRLGRLAATERLTLALQLIKKTESEVDWDDAMKRTEVARIGSKEAFFAPGRPKTGWVLGAAKAVDRLCDSRRSLVLVSQFMKNEVSDGSIARTVPVSDSQPAGTGGPGC